jgi:hypothetical protein
MQHSSSIHVNRLFIFAENLNAIHDFVKKSMKEKKQVIADGLSNFKEGLSDAFGDKQSYINLLTLPVNNFLKDISQIEKDFEAELKKNTEYCVYLDGKMIPANEVLCMPMEENY